MKKICLLVTVLLLCFNLFSQDSLPVDPESKKITFTEVVELPSTTKKTTITTRLSSWVKEKKYLAKTKQAPESFAFKGSIVMVYPGATTGKSDKGIVEFICTVYPKNGKYKYVFTNFKHQGVNGRGTGGLLENDTPECGKFILPLSSWKKIKLDLQQEMPEIVSEMKLALSGKAVTPKKKNPADF